MDRETSRMADRTRTINNNGNDGKSITACNSNSSVVPYNNNPASIMRSSNNSKSMAVCDSNKLSATHNKTPAGIIHSSSRSYSSHNKDG